MDVRLTVAAENGLVAVDDGRPWPGGTNLLLPFAQACEDADECETGLHERQKKSNSSSQDGDETRQK